MSDVEAYAYVEGGKILPSTVAATVRGTRVNALVMVFRIPVYSGYDDAKIRREFVGAALGRGGIRRVKITMLDEKDFWGDTANQPPADA